jgi:hypothetical protein
MNRFEFWKPLVVSLTLTPFALLAGFISAGAGHGNYFLAKILFPYTMLSTLLFNSITMPFVLIAFAQFPLYGLLLTITAESKRLWMLILIVSVHVAAATLCILQYPENFS